MLEELLQATESHGARLVAVSKTQSPERVMELYNRGHRIFGENRVQELQPKYEALPKDIEWHLIGHLQTNKVKYIAPFVQMIHSVDSLKLLQEIHKQADKAGRTIPCLFQFHVAQEDSKFGFSPEEGLSMLEEGSWRDCTHAPIHGVMGMASFTDDEEQVRGEFQQLKSLFDTIKTRHFPNDTRFSELSMGMSGDYPIALEEGSTLIRVGSLLFP